jgi:hypothetical protein
MEQTNRGFLFAMNVLLETSIEITLMFERRGEASTRRQSARWDDGITSPIECNIRSLLDELAAIRDSKGGTNFCIMGITMEDIYDGPSDLFLRRNCIWRLQSFHPFLFPLPSAHPTASSPALVSLWVRNQMELIFIKTTTIKIHLGFKPIFPTLRS